MGTWSKFFGTFCASALTDWTCLRLRVFGFNDSSVEDVTDWDGNGELEWGRFSLVPGALRIALIDAGHLFDASENVLAVSLVFLPLFLVDEGVIGYVKLLLPYLSNFSFFYLSSWLGRAYNFTFFSSYAFWTSSGEAVILSPNWAVFYRDSWNRCGRRCSWLWQGGRVRRSAVLLSFFLL